MKVFQTIHKYAPHIPAFEAKYGISDQSKITFEELRQLLIDDGYASSYILLPALQHRHDEVFFTLWDYERLQFIWAKENGLDSQDLAVIKLAQIKLFQPDVFYNFTAWADNSFIELLKLAGIKCKTVCWNGIIQPRPMCFPFYDLHLTLHRPYVNYWHGVGLKAAELQPGIPDNWVFTNSDRPLDILFYGQYLDGMFSSRNRYIDQLVEYSQKSSFRTGIYLQYDVQKRMIFKIPKIQGICITEYPSKRIRRLTQKPIYGNVLYEKIKQSKIVVNSYTDDNKFFKSNMRVFEAIGHGAFLISERGNYPEGLEPDVDFYTYQGFDELKEKIEYVLDNWNKHKLMALKAAQKIRDNFSKEKQWLKFQDIVNTI